jgi:CheY-like chemotaxis protein
MDVRMPGMDGCEAARALRAGGCRVPLIAVTVDVTPAVRANALAAGFDAVLSKPFDIGDLIHALQLVREGPSAEAGIISRAAKRDSGLP